MMPPWPVIDQKRRPDGRILVVFGKPGGGRHQILFEPWAPQLQRLAEVGQMLAERERPR